INDATPFGLEDQIALDLARERGILAPEYRPVWVRLNNNDLGVYRYEAQPDEGLLRRNRRVPGSMFSGDVKDAAGNPLGVFGSRAGWQKVASHSEQEADDFRELERLLEMVARSSHREFAAFAESHIDLDRYALFDALDVVFGGNEHNYLSNHRFYVDPYSGRFEPVAWSFRGFQNDPGFNAVDHPLLIRLKFTPGYLARRDRLVYELLTGAASVPAIRARVEEEFERLAPELAADPYWDAYKLLPRVSRFHRFMVRPMSAQRWLTSAQAELNTYARLARTLLAALESPRVDARWSSGAGATGRLAITVHGPAGWRLREVIGADGACRGELSVFGDLDLDGELNRAKDQQLSESAGDGRARITRLGHRAPGARLVSRADADPKRGHLRVANEPRTYLFFVGTPSCSPRRVAVELESEVTGASLQLEARPLEGDLTPPGDPRASERAFRFVAGEQAPHPWSFPPPPAPEVVRLGPGTVAFAQDKEFGPHQSVVISPGTTLALGPEVTLTFRGLVRAVGSAKEPISIVGAERGRPFGGVVLQGAGTQGSTLEWVHVEGGSSGRDAFGAHAGLLEIHATESVTLSNVFLRSGAHSEDVLHVAQVKGLRLNDVTVAAAPNDAIDLEFVSGEVRNVQVLGAADDCLDLMGVKLRVHDTVLLACQNNGMSAGEETKLDAHRLLVAGSRTGVLAKNGSEVRLTESVV
ncbi:MAG TPA: CotH kinase family protein, partial [Myxococcaceae bacterium]|nr:CotH kinase family protein [Myxococcaceae bacterium]